MRFSTLAALVVITLLGTPAHAQVLWQTEVLGASSVKMLTDADGNLYTVGARDNFVTVPRTYSDILLTKTSPDGVSLWQQFITADPGPGQTSNDATQDFGTDLALDSQGNIYITGFVSERGSRFERDAVIAKYAPDGTQLWENIYNGTNNHEDFAFKVLLDAADNAYVAGISAQTVNGGTDSHLALFKYAPDGALLWERHYNGSEGGYDDFGGVSFTPEGNIALLGVSFVDRFSVFDFDQPLMLIYSPEGDLVLEQPLLDAFATQHTFRIYDVQPYDGGLLADLEVSALPFVQNSPIVGRQLVKFETDGTISERTRLFPDSTWAVYQNEGLVVQAAQGEVWAAYQVSRSFSEDSRLLMRYADGAFTLANRADGEPGRTFDTSVLAMTIDAAGNVYVASGDRLNNELWIRRYDQDGMLVGSITLEGYAFTMSQIWVSNQYSVSLLAADEGRIYVSYHVNRNEGGATVKYQRTALVQINASSVSVADEEQPGQIRLEANYPNPFNPSTVLRFTLPTAQQVRLAVYDALGREVAVVRDGVLAAGTHEATFEAAGLPSGLYLYRLQADQQQQTRLMHLMK
ncbi:MAG: T9SS type A sorting domain-containing protein [Bacteroidota bacterium]